MLRIPVTVHGLTRENKHHTEEAETVVVSRLGALLRSRTAWKTGTNVDVTNSFTKLGDRFRVVWVSDQPKQGYFDIGIELLTQREDFWGVSFPAAQRA